MRPLIYYSGLLNLQCADSVRSQRAERDDEDEDEDEDKGEVKMKTKAKMAEDHDDDENNGVTLRTKMRTKG
jgi:hypothetical protein